MKNHLFIFILFLAFANSTKGQITFNKTFNRGIDGCFSVVENSLGYLSVINAGMPLVPQNIYLVQTNFFGDTLWTKVYGNQAQNFLIYSLLQTIDSNYVLGSYLYKYAERTISCYLLKINKNGDSLWSRTILPDSAYFFRGAYTIETSDGGFLISGQKEDTAQISGDAFIMKTDSTGNLQWYKSFGGGLYDNGYSATELPGKSFLMVGWKRINSTNRNVYLVKVDSAGSFLWEKTYGSTYSEIGIGIVPTQDGNYLLACDSADNIQDNGWLIKIDSGGNVIWQHSYVYNTSSAFQWARELSNGDMAAVGSKRNATNNRDDGWIACTDALGNLKWERTFPMNNNHACFRDFKQTRDSGFIIAGFCFTGASGNQDAWLVKLDSMGCDSVGCSSPAGIGEEQLTQDDVILYPNPAHDKLKLEVGKMKLEKAFVLNVIGEILWSGRQKEIDVSNLACGIYFVRVQTNKGVMVKKFIKE